MITETFDNKSRPLISPQQAIRPQDLELASNYSIKVCIVTFSYKLIKALLEDEIIEVIDERLKIGSAAAQNPIYRIKDTEIGVILCGIGAPMAAALVEELRVLFNCDKFIFFGSCGALVDIAESRIVIPYEAYRDEGTSYHYVKAADFITVKNAEKLADIMDEIGVGYVVGKTWTTDAFYRETEENKNKRVAQGCICVEMECSRLQAVCDFYGLQLYQFVYTADSLDNTWCRRILGNMEMDARLKYFYVAWEIAKRVI